MHRCRSLCRCGRRLPLVSLRSASLVTRVAEFVHGHVSIGPYSLHHGFSCEAITVTVRVRGESGGRESGGGEFEVGRVSKIRQTPIDLAKLVRDA